MGLDIPLLYEIQNVRNLHFLLSGKPTFLSTRVPQVRSSPARGWSVAGVGVGMLRSVGDSLIIGFWVSWFLVSWRIDVRFLGVCFLDILVFGFLVVCFKVCWFQIGFLV